MRSSISVVITNYDSFNLFDNETIDFAKLLLLSNLHLTKLISAKQNSISKL
jgi:hypothetical protein